MVAPDVETKSWVVDVYICVCAKLHAREAATPTITPPARDAHAYFQPSGPLTTTLGSKLTLELRVSSGTNLVTAQQSYLTFTSSILQAVDTAQAGCVITSVVAPDTTYFDAVRGRLDRYRHWLTPIYPRD